MSFTISFKGLNDLKVLDSDAFHALDDGADIREITQKLINDLSNEAAAVFGYGKITVRQKWLQIEWDLTRPISIFYNAGMYSSTGRLVYNPVLLAQVVNRFGKDTLLGILGHEVGHRMVHLLFIQRGIRINNWQNEYCADYIAGLLLRLGQCSPQGMNRFYREVCADGGRDHPPGASRAAVFMQGYQMIDHDRKTVFLRTPEFSRVIDTRQILTDDFMRDKLLNDVIKRTQRV